MKSKSFNFRLISLISFICITLSSLSAFILYRNNLDAKSYQHITSVSMPQMKVLGELLSTFRQVRIEVRSLGIEGNTRENNEQYKANALAEVAKFEKHLAEFKEFVQTEDGKRDYQNLEDSWKDFFAFGANILSLMEKNTPESMEKLRQDILEICPVKAAKISELLEKFSLNAKSSADALVAATHKDAQKTFFTAIVLVIGVSVLAIILGVTFASKISKALISGIERLYQTSGSLDEKTNHIRGASGSLSDAVQGHAAGLQEAASAINEISAMVSRNADNAKASVAKANSVTVLAQESKDKVTLMKHSISEIAEGNAEVLKEIADSNREINNIANIISEISTKTQVINDIVFQTKLLSFNASVEAARAGEHGKGFTVVAQEIGNLANMSGRAATEINDMLKNSVQDVEHILHKSEEVMKRVSKESISKMDSGLKLAEECDSELSEVLVEIAEVHQMIRAISDASSEQETGVKEVNKTMNELDSLIQGNASISMQTSRSAEDLEIEANTLNKITQNLREIAFGVKRDESNVVDLPIQSKVEIKEVIGL